MVLKRDKIYFRYENDFGQVHEGHIQFEGVIRNVERAIKRQVLIIFVSKWRNIWPNSIVQPVKEIA